ncbi:hypothetical protein B296_00038197, partial [Ensete ventricosum]
LSITTECGKLVVSPGEIVILPQGFRFSIDLPDGPSRGYVAEIFGEHFHLPDLGPIGIGFSTLAYMGHSTDGFLPGGASLHSCMTPHGPDTKTYEASIAVGENSEPVRLRGTMAFMFESNLIPRVCPWALDSPYLDANYYQCWIGLRSHFSSNNRSENGSLDVPDTTQVLSEEQGSV